MAQTRPSHRIKIDVSYRETLFQQSIEQSAKNILKQNYRSKGPVKTSLSETKLL
jgi:hypothetical protein